MTDDLRAARTLTQKDLDDAPVGTVVRAADGTIAARYDVAEAERAVDAMRRTAGIRAGVRALDALLDLGWRPGGER